MKIKEGHFVPFVWVCVSLLPSSRLDGNCMADTYYKLNAMKELLIQALERVGKYVFVELVA